MRYDERGVALMEAMIASVLIAKYAGIIVLSDLQGETLFPLLLERLNIFTDPQRPMVVEEDIYPLSGPGEDSPVLITSEIISFKKLMRTEYYNDFLRPQSIHDQMVIYMKSGDRLLGLAALFRPQKDTGFSPVDKAKAGLMAPYLTAALEKTIVSEENFARECIISSIVSNLPFKGIIVLDQSLEPIYQNENATSILYNLHRTKNHPKTHLAPIPKVI